MLLAIGRSKLKPAGNMEAELVEVLGVRGVTVIELVAGVTGSLWRGAGQDVPVFWQQVLQ
jgi:hypothetical protein